MSAATHLAEDLLRAGRTLALQRQPDGNFAVIGSRPDWFAALPEATEPVTVATVFPFLETFLPEAEIAWSLPDGPPVESDFWTAATVDGAEMHLGATAVPGRCGALLLVRPVEKYYRELRGRLQQARELMLEDERRGRENHLRELTVHCLVHDLIGNLAISGVIFDRFEKRPDLSDNDRNQLKVGREAARGVSNHLRDMVDLYAAELRAIEHFETAADRAPDLLDCVTQELIQFRPACDARRVTLSAELPEDLEERWPVQGDEGRLRRLIFNLLENALRHTPDSSRLQVQVNRAAGFAEFAIEDEGRGVDPAVAAHIFERFAGGRTGGKAGLGLYFVRTTVERWGGSVGHRTGSGGGARFHFRLPLATGETPR
jgi:signal transduction histidine kinase